jgi:1,2-diacylglycerol 3-alpha-glucosyltransferase
VLHRAAEDERLRLLLKAQVDRQRRQVLRLARGGRRLGRRDRRIELLVEELPTDRYLRLFAGIDACLAPSRWEGLGLHLYEATALGIPIITNDNPPMNEVVTDGENGILISGIPDGTARTGIPAFRHDPTELTAAIERIADPELRAELAGGARRVRERLSWERTASDLEALIDSLPAPA